MRNKLFIHVYVGCIAPILLLVAVPFLKVSYYSLRSEMYYKFTGFKLDYYMLDTLSNICFVALFMIVFFLVIKHKNELSMIFCLVLGMILSVLWFQAQFTWLYQMLSGQFRSNYFSSIVMNITFTEIVFAGYLLLLIFSAWNYLRLSKKRDLLSK